MLYQSEFLEPCFKLSDERLAILLDMGPLEDLVNVDLASVLKYTVYGFTKTIRTDFTSEIGQSSLLHEPRKVLFQ